MSSTITETEQQSVPKTQIKLTKKTEKLTRSGSIDKINAYICSHNYYILPAILYWIKASFLHSTVEKCLIQVKKIAYMIFEKNLREINTFVKNKGDLKFDKEDLKRILFIVGVYAGVSTIFTQLFLIVYLLNWFPPPNGMIFLFSCLYVICHMQIKIIRESARSKTERKSRMESQRKFITAKKILNSRTISNVNLF